MLVPAHLMLKKSSASAKKAAPAAPTVDATASRLQAETPAVTVDPEPVQAPVVQPEAAAPPPKIEQPMADAFRREEPGADVSFIHLLSEVDNDAVEIGMRVKAVWKPEEEWSYAMDNIRYWKPLDNESEKGGK